MDYRKENLGRATFIMLDKLNVDAAKLNPIETPENAPRYEPRSCFYGISTVMIGLMNGSCDDCSSLFDLIQPKNATYAKAFYHAVQDTLVATDMDQALRYVAVLPVKWIHPY